MSAKRFPKLVPFVDGKPYSTFPGKGTKIIQERWGGKTHSVEWVENKPFRTALKFKEIYSTYSGTTYVVFHTTDNKDTYRMSRSTFNEMMEKNGTFVLGVCIGSFLFERSGNNLWLAPEMFRTAENSE